MEVGRPGGGEQGVLAPRGSHANFEGLMGETGETRMRETVRVVRSED
jgi:hypothetical protein